MKLFAVTVLLATTMATSTAWAGTIMARVEKTGDNTLIYCTTLNGDEIERAFLTLYESDAAALAVVNREMEVSSDNIASYELPGQHDSIDGKCKFYLTEGSARITRGEFSLSMR